MHRPVSMPRLAVLVVTLCTAFTAAALSTRASGADQKEPFAFDDGTKYGAITTAGIFTPYTKGEVAAVLSNLFGRDGCDGTTQSCFIQAVNRQYATVTNAYKRFVESDAIVAALGYDDRRKSLRLPVSLESLPRQEDPNLHVARLFSAPAEGVKSLRNNEGTWTLNGARLVYASNVLKPAIKALKTHAEQGAVSPDYPPFGPDWLTVEMFHGGTRRAIVILADNDGDETVDEVTFVHPYEPVPRYSPEKKQNEWAIYGVGLIRGTVRSEVQVGSSEFIGLPAPPSTMAEPGIETFSLNDNKFASSRATIQGYYRAAIDMLRDLDKKLATPR